MAVMSKYPESCWLAALVLGSSDYKDPVTTRSVVTEEGSDPCKVSHQCAESDKREQ